jgi:outer membrane protein insertion porin family
VKEKGKYKIRTGAEAGNAEGNTFIDVTFRNIFGGAEFLNLNAAFGTRTRSAYQASFGSPILSNPDFKWEVGGIQSATTKSFASHDELLRKGWASLRYATADGHAHDFAYNGAWRQVTSLAENASPSIRRDAGDSVKSSISHTWSIDTRNHPNIPSSGYYTKTISEIAGWGPLGGDVAFWKSEVESQVALPIPVSLPGISFTTGFRAGLLYPLALASDSRPLPSRINDRFQLGGPADVRGFRIAGLGPREGNDSLGGDLYAAASANLLVPLPSIGAERPFRLQAFVNGGRLLSLQNPNENDGQMNSKDVQKSVYSGIGELFSSMPSVTAGVGLVYAHPAARFELNFSLPITVRGREDARKGLQVGVGINLL